MSAGGNIYAGANYGLFRTNNNAQNWDGSGVYFTNALASNVNYLFGGTEYGVYVSADGGITWSFTDNILSTNYITSLAVQGNNLFASCLYGGVFRSTDNGNNFQQIDSGMDYNTAAWCLAVSDTGIFAGTGSGVYLSTDSGNTWAKVNSGLTDTGVYSLAINGRNLYAGTTEGVFISNNFAMSWTISDSGFPTGYFADAVVRALTLAGGNIVAGTDSGIYISTNNGISWQVSNTGLTSYVQVNALLTANGYLYAGTSVGVFLSSDGGLSWTAANTGIGSLAVFTLAVHGSSIYTGTFGDGAFASTNGGLSWVPVDSGMPRNSTDYTFAFSDSNIFVGTENYGAYRSSSNGALWQPVNTQGFTSQGFVISMAASDSAVFACTDSNTCGLFETTNGGASWRDIAINDVANTVAINGSNLFLGSDSTLYMSTDNGQTWTNMANGSPYLEQSFIGIFTIVFYQNNIFLGTNYGILKSPDMGQTWTWANSTSAMSLVQAIAISDSGMFAATGGGVYMSRDSGSTWRQIYGGWPEQTSVYSVAVSDNELYAGTSGFSVWQHPLSGFVYTLIDTVKIVNPSCTGAPGSAAVSCTGGTGSYSFDWSNGDTSAGINNLQAGTYYVTITSGTHVLVDSAVIADTLSRIINISFGVVPYYCDSEQVIVYPIGGNSPYTYQWSNGSDSSSAIVTPNQEYSVTVWCNNSCAATDSGSFVCSGVPFLNAGRNDVHVYPNPAGDWLEVQSAGAMENSIIRVSNMEGQILMEQRPDNTWRQLIDISNLSAGVYLFSLITSAEISTVRFVKQ